MNEFAEIIRTIGRGPQLSRPLDRDEARRAMTAIIEGRAEPVQLGAFLLLLRYRRETAEELAGMADAVEASLDPALTKCDVALDWPSYADRHRQQPWFILSALLLAGHGVRILMHGLAGADDGFAPTRPVLDLLGVPRADSPSALAGAFARSNLVYLGVEHFAPALEQLFGLRPLLGVRTAANTLARAINPAGAPVQLQGVFHPNYRELHRDVARLRDQPVAAVFKGGGGEVQCNPIKACRIAWLRDGAALDEEWPAALPGQNFDWRGEDLSAETIADLWFGRLAHPAAEAAVKTTVAIALRALGRAADSAEAEKLAASLWAERPAASAAQSSGDGHI